MARFQLYFSLNFLRASYFRSSLLLRTEELKFPPAICLIAQVKTVSICLDTILNVVSTLVWYLLSHIRKSRPCEPSLKQAKTDHSVHHHKEKECVLLVYYRSMFPNWKMRCSLNKWLGSKGFRALSTTSTSFVFWLVHCMLRHVSVYCDWPQLWLRWPGWSSKILVWSVEKRRCHITAH